MPAGMVVIEEHHDRVVAIVEEDRVTVELRAPREGELGWWVDDEVSAEEALIDVVAGRTRDGRYGWMVQCREPPAFDRDDGMRTVAVTVDDAGAPMCPACGGALGSWDDACTSCAWARPAWPFEDR